MAKLRRPSQRTIDIYNQLVEQQNKVRKTLLKMHKQAEEVLTAGRLPALVIPRRARKYRNVFYEGLSKAELSRRLKAFWNKYRLAKEMFSGGISSYLKKTVMEGYKELWQSKDGIGEEPKGLFGRYTDEQILYSDNGTAMEAYNMLFTHGVDLFMALLYTHKVIQFTFIYDDIHHKVEKNTYLNQQIMNIEDFVKSPKARAGLYKTVDYLRVFYKEKTYTGKHRKSTLKKAKEDEEE